MEVNGREITVWLKTGEEVHGWMGEPPRWNFLISTSEDGSVVRLIRGDAWEHAQFANEPEPRYPESIDPSALYALSERLDQPLRKAIDQCDIRRVRRITTRLETFAGRAARLLAQGQESDALEDTSLIDKVSVVHLQTELLDEFDQSGVTQVIFDNEENVRAVVSVSVLPWQDQASQMDLDEMVKMAKAQGGLRETNAGRAYTERAVATMATEFTTEHASIAPVDAGVHKQRRLQRLAADLKLAAGAGMAGANVGVMIGAGTLAILPTVGAGLIPVVVAVGVSIFSGMSTATDGLRDWAVARDPS